MNSLAQISTRNLERRRAKLKKLAASPELAAIDRELQARHKAKVFTPIAEAELAKWSTKRLLLYAKGLRRPAYFSDYDDIDTQEWQKPYIAELEKVRAILATREHVPDETLRDYRETRRYKYAQSTVVKPTHKRALWVDKKRTRRAGKLVTDER